MNRFKSQFAETLSAYVELRRNLGYKFETPADVLAKFDAYVRGARHVGCITQDLAVSFATSNAKISTAECWRRYQYVRHFAEYLAVFQPESPRLDPHAIRRDSRRPTPYVYADSEIEQLLEAARTVSQRRPIVGITLHAIIGVAASTGLRLGEVVGLDKSDVDLDQCLMTIRCSKFKKDRLVPMDPTTAEVLRNYASARDAVYPEHDSPAFFISLWKRRFAKHSVTYAFTELARKVGLRGPKGRGPSFHGLRHRFAVRRLVTWYEEGVDVQTMLPALATYMGHASYADTAYYLTATAELMELAALRYHRSWSPVSGSSS